MRFLSLLMGVTIIFVSLGLESGYAQQMHKEDFVLLYNFDENTGNIAKDLSAKGNDGDITDAKWTPNGKFGGGMEFNGEVDGSKIEVPHHESLDPGGDQMTIMAWIKLSSLSPGGAFAAIARKGIAGETATWGFDTPDGKLRTFIFSPGVTVANGESTLNVDKWNHVAVVYDGKEITLYLNGEVDGTAGASGDILLSEVAVRIGTGKKAGLNHLHGIMDELAILNIALTEAEIKEFMAGGIIMAVDASGKLAVSWGAIKIQ